MKLPKEDKPKLLTREEILNFEEPPKKVELPSGVIVTIKYLAFFAVFEILNSVESEKNKESLFAKKIVKLLLRENEEKDLTSFTREDQIALIRYAAQEWGCKEEFEKLPDSLSPENRFYQAVIDKNNRFQQQMSASIANLIAPQMTWLDDYQQVLKDITSQVTFPASIQLNEFANLISRDTLEQFSQLGQYAVQISKLDDLMKSFKTITIPYEELLLSSTREVLTRYRELMENLVSIENFRVLPDVERYYPSLEVRNLSIATNMILARDEFEVTDEIIILDGDELEIWLGELDGSFPDMLLGAEQAITSNNPDRCRHFASSHRELCTHILHLLAPDDDVAEWTNDPNHFHEGHPTRRARLLYIARHSKNEPFVDFFVSSFLNQINLLNADEHRRYQDYGENELKILHDSFLSTLSMLMELVRSE